MDNNVELYKLSVSALGFVSLILVNVLIYTIFSLRKNDKQHFENNEKTIVAIAEIKTRLEYLKTYGVIKRTKK